MVVFNPVTRWFSCGENWRCFQSQDHKTCKKYLFLNYSVSLPAAVSAVRLFLVSVSYQFQVDLTYDPWQLQREQPRSALMPPNNSSFTDWGNRKHFWRRSFWTQFNKITVNVLSVEANIMLCLKLEAGKHLHAAALSLIFSITFSSTIMFNHH